MAFINQVMAKDDVFIRVGEVYSANGNDVDRTLSSDSINKVTFTPAVTSFDANELSKKLVVFENGQVKYITTANSSTEFSVANNFLVPNGTKFKIHNTSLMIDSSSRIHFGRTAPSNIMLSETGIDLNYGRIRNVALPTHAHDVATKQYVDSMKLGLWNHIEKFSGDGVNTVFTVSEPISMYNAIVSVGGVIQEPIVAYEIQVNDGVTTINFKEEAPPKETDITIRTTTATNMLMSPAVEEIFVAQTSGQDTFILDNEVYDKYGILISIDGVVQSTLNYDILTTPVQIEDTEEGTRIYRGNEYRVLKFAEGLDFGATVRVLNIRGKGFHSHSGTFIKLSNITPVPTAINSANGYFDYDSLANQNFTANITHDMIASRGGLHLLANTTTDNLYINLPEMGSEYSSDYELEVKVVKGSNTANVYLNAHPANFMNYEGVLDGHIGGGVVYNQQPDMPAVIHLAYESYYRTWYIKYGTGLWNVNANTINYPNVLP